MLFAAGEPPAVITLRDDDAALDVDDVIPDQLTDAADFTMHVLFNQRRQVVTGIEHVRNEQQGIGAELFTAISKASSSLTGVPSGQVRCSTRLPGSWERFTS